MKSTPLVFLLLAILLSSCGSYGDYTIGSKDLGYSYAKPKIYTDIYKALEAPEKVEYISLNYNSSKKDEQIRLLDQHAEKFVNLKKLSIYGMVSWEKRESTYFPKNIIKCQKLEFLALGSYRNLSDDDLEIIAQLPNLIFLALGVCDLEQFPDQVCALKNLKGLDLTGNRIPTIPTSIKELPKLETVDLSNNSLSAFPSNLHLCPNLKYLELNNVEAKSAAMAAQFGIGWNTLSTIDGLEHFKSLEQLILAGLLYKEDLAKLKTSYPNIKIK